jgi:peptidoglycan/LPS O-acetylase OafA/YrhL
MKYIKQFDGLRGIAVLIVVVYHWLHTSQMDRVIPNGFNIVDVFFVLSGFLITRILLESRERAEEEKIRKVNVYKFFFLNRALRIFPIYYLTILVIFLIEGIGKTKMASLLSYTYNFYAFRAQSWDEFFGHVWTLGVEEQFYIFWPWIILLCRKRFLPHIISLFVIGGSFCEYLVRHNTFGHVLPFSCFDSLGMGAFLSWIYVHRPSWLKPSLQVSGVLSIVLGSLFLVEFYRQDWSFIVSRLTLSVATFWLLAFILYRVESNRLNRYFILNNAQLIWLGKISYGMYLYHIILPDYTWRLFLPLNQLAPRLLYNDYVLNAENFFALVLFSWLSYRLVERPILRLRHRFLPKKAGEGRPVVPTSGANRGGFYRFRELFGRKPAGAIDPS